MLNVPVANHKYFGTLNRFGIPEFSLFGALSALPFWLGVDRPSLSVVEAVSGFLGWLLVSDWLDWGVADWSIFFSGGIRNIEILIFVARGKSLFLFKKFWSKIFGPMKIHYLFRCNNLGFIIKRKILGGKFYFTKNFLENFPILQCEPRKMEPQLKNSHELIGIAFIWGSISCGSHCRNKKFLAYLIYHYQR